MTQVKIDGTATGSKAEIVDTLPGKKVKQSYTKPALICHGDVRDVTLGASPAPGESGMTATKKP